MTVDFQNWTFCSMLNLRFIKLLLLFSLFLCLLTYSQYFTDIQQSDIGLQIKPTCSRGVVNGLNCDTPKRTITKKSKPKPTKKKKTLVKVPNLEKVHILPNTIPTEGKNLTTTYFRNNPQGHHRPTGTKKVLIISYFDSSSPQIGNILNQHPDLFYFKEPLYSFDSTTLRDGEEPISRRFISEATDYLSDLFECKILDSKLGYSNKITKKMANKAYNSCHEQLGNVSECVQETCKSKRVILSKTIRIYIQDVQAILMRNRGSMKVIILQHDPRVNLHMRNRRTHSGWTAGSDMFFQGRSLCSRMLNDVLNARRLEGSGYKDFYRIVLYEHFLKNPEHILRGILSFIGVSSDLGVAKDLLRSANAYKHLQKVRLNKWEWIPDDDEGLSIDKGCTFLYKNSLYNPMMQTPGVIQRYNLCQYCD